MQIHSFVLFKVWMSISISFCARFLSDTSHSNSWTRSLNSDVLSITRSSNLSCASLRETCTLLRSAMTNANPTDIMVKTLMNIWRYNSEILGDSRTTKGPKPRSVAHRANAQKTKTAVAVSRGEKRYAIQTKTGSKIYLN